MPYQSPPDSVPHNIGGARRVVDVLGSRGRVGRAGGVSGGERVAFSSKVPAKWNKQPRDSKAATCHLKYPKREI